MAELPESGTPEWETWIAADLLAKAWWSNYDPQDPKGGRDYPGFGGDPEWQKNTGRWLKRYMDAHGRPDSWPWKAPEFDYLDPSKTVGEADGVMPGVR